MGHMFQFLQALDAIRRYLKSFLSSGNSLNSVLFIFLFVSFLCHITDWGTCMEGRVLKVNKWDTFSGNRYSRCYGFFHSSEILHADSASLLSSSGLEFGIGVFSSIVSQEIYFHPILKRQFGSKYFVNPPNSLAWRKMSFFFFLKV